MVASGFAASWSGLDFEIHAQGQWMGWNLLLAVIPGIGALGLYAWRRGRRPAWWALAVAVALMLPNAPYVVTDLVHLPGALRHAPNDAAVVAGVVPLFAVLIGTGVLSYALSVHLLRKELLRRGWSRRRRISAEAVMHGACAIGVALGRVPRLNSWDFFRPVHMLDGLSALAVDPRAVVLALAAVILAGGVTDRMMTGAVHAVRHRLQRR